MGKGCREWGLTAGGCLGPGDRASGGSQHRSWTREITGSTVCGCVIVSSQRTPAHQSSPSSAVVRKLYLPPELGITVSASLACQSLFF